MVIKRYSVATLGIKIYKKMINYKEKNNYNRENINYNGGVDMNNNTVERYCTVTESLEQSLKEMQLMRQGKLHKKTWREYREEKAKQREKEDRSLS